MAARDPVNNEENYDAFIEALEEYDYDTMNSLLARNYDVNYLPEVGDFEYTPLEQALAMSPTEPNIVLLKYLIDNGADVNDEVNPFRTVRNADGRPLFRDNVLSYAIHNRKEPFVRILVESGAKLPRNYNRTTDKRGYDYYDNIIKKMKREAFEKKIDISRKKTAIKEKMHEATGDWTVGHLVSEYALPKVGGKKTRKRKHKYNTRSKKCKSSRKYKKVSRKNRRRR